MANIMTTLDCSSFSKGAGVNILPLNAVSFLPWPHLFIQAEILMRRNDPIFETGSIGYQDLIQQIAFHEAGHAAGIHLYLKEKRLPTVCFQIKLKEPDFVLNSSLKYGLSSANSFVAEVEGGRLIPELPAGLLESANFFSAAEPDAYQSALEADMINLLIGALAEAKHVALRDHNYFDPQSVHISSLRRYGGQSDLEEVRESLESTIASKQTREETLIRLFGKALRFIANPNHWRAIERLANYILVHRETLICCEKAIAVLDEAIAHN